MERSRRLPKSRALVQGDEAIRNRDEATPKRGEEQAQATILVFQKPNGNVTSAIEVLTTDNSSMSMDTKKDLLVHFFLGDLDGYF